MTDYDRIKNLSGILPWPVNHSTAAVPGAAVRPLVGLGFCRQRR
jgi:hypothetical protein